MKILTTCTRDCPGSCGLTVNVSGGEVRSIEGSRLHPYMRGFICRNTSRYHTKRLYSNKRILKPLKRDGRQWKTISWDEALHVISDKLNECMDEYGAESIVYYQGFGARTALRLLNRRFFNLIGATTLQGTLCGGTAIAAQSRDFGRRMSHDPSDHIRSKNIFIWGRNPAVTDINLWKLIKRARAQGTRIVTIDPIRALTAVKSDIHCQIKPGKDLYLAIAMAKIIIAEGLYVSEFIEKYAENFDSYMKILDETSLNQLSEMTGVPLKMIHKLAHLYSDGPSSIIIGWGLQRYFNSHLTCRFIDSLAAISGYIGVSGGGVSSGFDEYGSFDKSVTLEMEGSGRKISMPLFGREILNMESPPVNCVFITAGNPVTLGPNSIQTLNALREVDFVVMVDHFLNDTSHAADLFLPATTFLEETDLVGSYGHPYVSPVNVAVRPLGECHSEFWILQRLSEIMGVEGMRGTEMEWLEIIASRVLDYHGIEIHDLLEKPYRSPAFPVVAFEGYEFCTESGRFNLPSESPYKIMQHDGEPLENSIRLLTVMSPGWVGSGEPPIHEDLIEIYLNPETLLGLGFRDGEISVVESYAGKTCAIIRSSDDVHPLCALSFRGTWLSNGGCINTVVEDRETMMGHGTAYNETRIKLKKISGGIPVHEVCHEANKYKSRHYE
ncbi:MAG: molybdopterin-dependent oxidoreductase [Methanothermobacter sp.]|nr:molybdopterin-dependent oxidoreductase [Methanothermobacter sp.]